jgi:hypothetical protein
MRLLRDRLARQRNRHARDCPNVASRSFSVRVLRIPDREPLQVALVALVVLALAVRLCVRVSAVVRILRALARRACVRR